MTQDDIKELAERISLATAKEVYGIEQEVDLDEVFDDKEQQFNDLLCRRFLAAYLAEPVAQVHPNHLRKEANGGPWCREVLLYSGDNQGDLLDGENYRVKLFTAPPLPDTAPQPEYQLGTGHGAQFSVGTAPFPARLRAYAKDCTELKVHYVLLHDADMLERMADQLEKSK